MERVLVGRRVPADGGVEDLRAEVHVVKEGKGGIGVAKYGPGRERRLAEVGRRRVDGWV